MPHNVLNAKQHEKEAGVIAQAGRPGTVTIATNMAGRGVDILLGGNPDGLARERLRNEGVDLAALGEDDPVWQAALAQAKAECEADRQKVLAAGGLHVLGTERHEARRIDNQLRGRAGRQGDPGSSRFYVSLEDDLMRRFGGQSVSGLMDRLRLDEDMPIEARAGQQGHRERPDAGRRLQLRHAQARAGIRRRRQQAARGDLQPAAADPQRADHATDDHGHGRGRDDRALVQMLRAARTAASGIWSAWRRS